MALKISIRVYPPNPRYRIRNFSKKAEKFMANEFELNPNDLKAELFSYYDDIENGVAVEHKLFDELISELKSGNDSFTDKSLHAEGGSKVVSKIKDLRTSRFVAIAELKMGFTDAQAERFLHEARITAALEHPNIVPIHDIGLNKHGKPFFTMKFLRDQSLHKVIKELRLNTPKYIKKYSKTNLLEIFVKVCEAVSYAHSKGVVHLDLKPANIMIGDYGEVYVCNWGLAKLLQEEEHTTTVIDIFDANLVNDITLDGVVKGTPGYMAPEQIDSSVSNKDQQTDIFSLGAILYTILTLKSPYTGLSVKQILNSTLKGGLKPPQNLRKSVSDSLNAVVMKAMATKKESRYQTVEALVDEIRAFQEGFATRAEEASFVKSLLLFIKRHKFGSFFLLSVFFTSLFLGALIKKNELKVRSALVLYESEKSKKEKHLLVAAPELIKSWNRSIESLDSVWLHSQLDDILRIEPQNEKAANLKCYLHLLNFDFYKTVELSRKIKKPKREVGFKRARRIAETCLKDFIKHGYVLPDTALKCSRMDNFTKHYSIMAKMFLAAVFERLKTDEERSYLVLKTLKLYGNRNLNLDSKCVSTGGERISLNLSKSRLRSLSGIEYFRIHNWDLSYSSLNYFPATSNLAINVINLAGCEKLRNSNWLTELPNLKKVTIPKQKSWNSVVEVLGKNGVTVKKQ